MHDEMFLVDCEKRECDAGTVLMILCKAFLSSAHVLTIAIV